MTNYYLPIFTLLFSVNTHAQVQHIQVPVGLTISGNGTYGANFLNNKNVSVFSANTLNYTTPISVKEINRLGVDAQASIYYQTKAKHGISYLVGMATTTFINAKLSTDAANIIAYGNYYYEGKQANLSNSFYQQYNTQQVQLGITLHKPDSTTQLQLIGSVIGVKKYTEVNINYLKLSTTPYFTAISGQGNYNAILSDTAGNTARYSGIGGTISLMATTTIAHSFATKAYYGLRNVGGIHLNKRAVLLHKTGSFLYDGVTINSIANLRDTNLVRNTLQHLKDSLYTLRTGTYSTMLPWNMYVAFDSKLHKNWSAHYGLNYQYSVGYIPLFFAQFGQNYKHVSWAVTNAYGGYSGYSLGVNAGVYNKRCMLYLGIKNLLLLANNKVNQGVELGINIPLNY